MKKSAKGVLASFGISTLIAGGSLPLMAADNTAAGQLKEGKAGKRCAGMKNVAPTVKGSVVIQSASELKDNPAGRKCGGVKPVTVKDGVLIQSATELKDNPAGRRCGGMTPAVKVDAPVKVAP